MCGFVFTVVSYGTSIKVFILAQKIAFNASCDSKGPTTKFICPLENIYLVLRSQVMLQKLL